MKDEIKISVIATGFDESRRRLQSFVNRPVSPFVSPSETQSTDFSTRNTSTQDDSDDPPPSSPKLDDKFQHSEVDIDNELDIPAFLRRKS